VFLEGKNNFVGDFGDEAKGNFSGRDAAETNRIFKGTIINETHIENL
jgi:hypothetical protein